MPGPQINTESAIREYEAAQGDHRHPRTVAFAGRDIDTSAPLLCAKPRGDLLAGGIARLRRDATALALTPGKVGWAWSEVARHLEAADVAARQATEWEVTRR